MSVENWVKFKYRNNEIIGYIVFEDYSMIDVQPTKPYDADIIKVYKYDTKFSIIELEIDRGMIDDMIDLALKIKDEKWFYELMEMRSGK